MQRHPALLQLSREHCAALKLARFADSLGTHVRFGERQVFEAVQAQAMLPAGG